MELRQYWRILRRRLWVVLVVTAGALAASLLLGSTGRPTYVATTRLIISLAPEEKAGSYYGYDSLYAFQSAEFLVDDFAELAKSQAFREDIRRAINDPAADLGSISGVRSTEKSHRILTLKVAHGDPAMAERIARAAAEALDANASRYFAQLQARRATLTVIDPATVSLEAGPARSTLDVALRTGLGLMAGSALAFLLHYVDPMVRDTPDAEALLGLPILGEIPPG